MKYYSRLKLYRASNVQFNPETLKAYSYGWWQFVGLINGKVVFNNYRYSNTTCKHQYKVRRLLKELNIPVDLTIEVPRGLDDLDSAKTWYKSQIAVLNEQIDRPRSQKVKNLDRRAQICEYMSKIVEVERLILSQNQKGL